MITKTVDEAAASFARTVDEVVEGRPVVITRDGRPVAAIVTISDYEWLDEVEDEWLSKLAAEALEEHRRDPQAARPAEDVFRELRERDEREAHAAE